MFAVVCTGIGWVVQFVVKSVSQIEDYKEDKEYGITTKIKTILEEMAALKHLRC
jgi:hypothetical protein